MGSKSKIFIPVNHNEGKRSISRTDIYLDPKSIYSEVSLKQGRTTSIGTSHIVKHSYLFNNTSKNPLNRHKDFSKPKYLNRTNFSTFLDTDDDKSRLKVLENYKKINKMLR